MTNNAKWALEPPIVEKSLSKLWRKLSMNPVIVDRCFKYLKVANIAVRHVLGIIEDERTSFTLNFLKSKLRNKLTPRVNMCMRMFA